MKFRYFELTGEELKAYLDAEAEEFRQRQYQSDILLQNHGDEVEAFRPDHRGGVMSIVFKEGKQPDGFIKARRDLPKKEVRPSKKGKAAEPWRKLLDEIKVTVDCQDETRARLGLPTYVAGPDRHSRSGMALYSTVFGHVGDKVIARVPVTPIEEGPVTPVDEGPDEYTEKVKPLVISPLLIEMQAWEVEKLHTEKAKPHIGYRLPSLTV